MATGKASDFKIYNDQIHAGMVETLVQNTDAFNAASAGTIRLVSKRLPGDYEYNSFFPKISNLITRRDTTSVAAATDIAVTQNEMISVKLNRKIGPIAQTLDAFRKIGSQSGINSLSFLIGTMIAKEMIAEQLNTGLSANLGSMTAQSTLTFDRSGGTIRTADLVDTLALMGDQADRVKMWVMHSKVYYDLVKEQIAANITGVANLNVATATPITLNRPVIVTDSADLKSSATVPIYSSFGLVDDSIRLEDSEEELIHAEIESGKENLIVRLQGEYAYNLQVKGTKYDVSNGGANPNSAAVALSTNWDKVAADVKDMSGVMCNSQ